MHKIFMAIVGYVGLGLFAVWLAPAPKLPVVSEAKFGQKEYVEEACTDPYYTVVIDGVTYSGSTKTAQEAYLEGEKRLKKVLYDETLTEEDRWKRVETIQEYMAHLNKFRCKCKDNVQQKIDHE